MNSSSNALLWTSDNGIVIPPVATPSVSIPGNIYVGGNVILSSNVGGSNQPTLQQQIATLTARIENAETGSNLDARMNSLITNVLDPLSSYTSLYTTGAIDELQTIFGYEQYRDIIVALGNEAYPPSIPYTTIMNYIFDSIEGLYKAVLLNVAYKLEILTLENQVTTLQNQINNTSIPPVMTVESALNVVATIRPEIQIYINLYGFPAGAVFDAQLLYDILADLNANP